MGQTPKARLYYGLYFDYSELPEEIQEIDDPEDVIDIGLGIRGQKLPYGERLVQRGSLSTHFIGERDALILAGFYVAVTSWGHTNFLIPEHLHSVQAILRQLAIRMGIEITVEHVCGWYLEAAFG